jgi:hypothetical protein
MLISLIVCPTGRSLILGSFNDVFSCIGYLASNGRITGKPELVRCETKWSWPILGVVPAFDWRDWGGGGNEKPQSWWQVPGPMFEPGTSWIRNRICSHLTSTFDRNWLSICLSVHLSVTSGLLVCMAGWQVVCLCNDRWDSVRLSVTDRLPGWLTDLYPSD